MARLLTVGVVCALLPSARAFGVDWSQAQQVTLTTVEYVFEPSHLVFCHGVAYRLHVENHGRELHELTAPDFFKTAALGNPEILNRERTEIVLQPNEQKDLYFVAPQPGNYRMWCADHDWAGMIGDITIK
jgi:uncharacterized cupredoxin-like copper-binding protein